MLNTKKQLLLLSGLIVLGSAQYSCCLNANNEGASLDHRNNTTAVQVGTKQKNNLVAVNDSEDLDEESNEEAIQNNKSNISTWLGVGAVGLGFSFLVYRVVQYIHDTGQQDSTTSQDNENERLRRSVVLRTVADIQPDPAYNEPVASIGDQCTICMQEAVLIELHGQFTCCRNCMLDQVLNTYQNQRANLHNMPCPFHGDCGQRLSLQDYKIITRGNQVIAATFEAARLNAQNPGRIDLNNIDPRDAEYVLRNTVECPGCHARIQRNEGCNHMTCNQIVASGPRQGERCGHQFCYICLRAWAMGAGPNAHDNYYMCRFRPNDPRNGHH